MRVYLDNCCYNRPYDDQSQIRIHLETIVDAERFIALIKRDSFDYTAWQREYFDKMKPGQIFEEAIKYEKEHPYKGGAVVI